MRLRNVALVGLACVGSTGYVAYGSSGFAEHVRGDLSKLGLNEPSSTKIVVTRKGNDKATVSDGNKSCTVSIKEAKQLKHGSGGLTCP